ncbi:MAG: HAMP domain-containing protein [Pseudomonadota bacterium]|nr:HAMP domain-containing protein [Pseudomonadota bacterium]
MRKKLFLLNRDFQFRYIGLVIAVGSFSTLLTMLIILYPLFAFRILRIPEFLPFPIFVGMALAVLMNIAVIGVMTMFITHRIVGPLYNLVRNMRRFESGNWGGHVTVRENDELKYVMRNFNEMVDRIIQQTEQDRDALLSDPEPTATVRKVADGMNSRTRTFRHLHQEDRSDLQA